MYRYNKFKVLTSNCTNATIENKRIRWFQCTDHIDIFIKIIIFRWLLGRDGNSKIAYSIAFSLKRLEYYFNLFKSIVHISIWQSGSYLLLVFELRQLRYNKVPRFRQLYKKVRVASWMIQLNKILHSSWWTNSKPPKDLASFKTSNFNLSSTFSKRIELIPRKARMFCIGSAYSRNT